MTHVRQTTPNAVSVDDLLQQYPQLNVPQVSRRALLAMGSLMALNLAACGSSDDSASGTAASTSNYTYANGGVVTTLAGGGPSNPGSADGTGTAARFRYPRGVAVDGSGNVYVADTYNRLIRKITSGGVVTTLAGSGTMGSTNGTGTAASFTNPYGVAVDSSGNVYVADTVNNLIRKIS